MPHLFEEVIKCVCSLKWLKWMGSECHHWCRMALSQNFWWFLVTMRRASESFLIRSSCKDFSMRSSYHKTDQMQVLKKVYPNSIIRSCSSKCGSKVLDAWKTEMNTILTTSLSLHSPSHKLVQIFSSTGTRWSWIQPSSPCTRLITSIRMAMDAT